MPLQDTIIDTQPQTTKRRLKRPFSALQADGAGATISTQSKRSFIPDLGSLSRLLSNKENLAPSRLWPRKSSSSTSTLTRSIRIVPPASSRVPSSGETRTAIPAHSPLKRRHSVLESDTELDISSRPAKRLSLPIPLRNAALQRKVTPLRDWVKKKSQAEMGEKNPAHSTPDIMTFAEPVRSSREREAETACLSSTMTLLCALQPTIINPTALWLTRTPGFRCSVPDNAWATTCQPRTIYWKRV